MVNRRGFIGRLLSAPIGGLLAPKLLAREQPDIATFETTRAQIVTLPTENMIVKTTTGATTCANFLIYYVEL